MTKLNFDNQTSFDGDFVLTGQETADEQGFSKVSKIWYDKTLSYEDGLRKLAVEKAKLEEYLVHPSDFGITIKDNELLMNIGDNQFHLTNHALMGMCSKANATFSSGMMGTGILKKNTDMERYFQATPVSITANESFRPLVENYLSTLYKELPDKPFKVRVRDGYVRAFLSEQYSYINNGWMIETLANILPNGRLSHFDQSTPETIGGNILINDSLLSEDDSDYGGMLAITNCEIGTRRCSITPSIFRAICMNGCIWDQKKGESFSVVHRGEKDLASLRDEMKRCIESQLDLIPDAIQAFLAAKQWTLTAKPGQVFAEMVFQLKLSKGDGQEMLSQWKNKENGDHTAFAMLNSVTRTSQTLHPVDWERVDRFIGSLITKGESSWETFQRRAKTRSNEWVKKVLA